MVTSPKTQKLLDERIPTPTEWINMTVESGIKARLKSLIGSERGYRLRSVDDAYKDWHANRNSMRATFRLNVTLNAYINGHGGVNNLTRAPALFADIERMTRYAHLRVDRPPSMEAAMSDSQYQDAATQWFYDCIAWPNVRRDIITLFANIKISPLYAAEVTNFLTLGASAAVATGTRGGGNFLSESAKADEIASSVGSAVNLSESMGLSATAREKILGKPKNKNNMTALAKDCELTVTQVALPTVDALAEGSVTLNSGEIGSTVETPPGMIATVQAKWRKFVEWIKAKFSEFIEWLKPKLEKQFSTVQGWTDVLFGLTNLIVSNVAKSAAPLVGAGLELASNIEKSVERAIAAIKLKVAERKALPLSGTMQQLVNAFREQAALDATLSGLSSILSAIKITAEVLTAGATLFVNMIIEGLKWLTATIYKVLEARKIKAFAEQMRLLFSYATPMGFTEVETTTSGEEMLCGIPDQSLAEQLNGQSLPVSDDFRGSFSATSHQDKKVVFDDDWSFKKLMTTACQASILFPSLIMVSGVMENHGAGLMFQYTSDQKTGEVEERLVNLLRDEARDYLTKRGFEITPEIQTFRSKGLQDRWEWMQGELFANLTTPTRPQG